MLQRAFASRAVLSGEKLVCLGKMYLEHAKELGDAVPDKPVIFNKFGSVTHRAPGGGKVLDVSHILPKDRGPIHYEAEICLQLGAASRIEAVTLGLDLTLRELQGRLKKDGHPWEIAKCFPGSAIIGPWIPMEAFDDYLHQKFSFSLDGSLKQHGKGTEMRMSPQEAISYVEEYFPLCKGDIVFTGTPAGVGEIKPGQLGELVWADKLTYQQYTDKDNSLPQSLKLAMAEALHPAAPAQTSAAESAAALLFHLAEEESL